MKRVIYLIIFAMSLTLVFSQGKPCCKNKSYKGKVACKFNRANIDLNKDGTVAEDGTQIAVAGIQCPLNVQNTSINKKNCTNCAKSAWWKFWGKKKGCCNTNS